MSASPISGARAPASSATACAVRPMAMATKRSAARDRRARRMRVCMRLRAGRPTPGPDSLVELFAKVRGKGARRLHETAAVHEEARRTVDPRVLAGLLVALDAA